MPPSTCRARCTQASLLRQQGAWHRRSPAWHGGCRGLPGRMLGGAPGSLTASRLGGSGGKAGGRVMGETNKAPLGVSMDSQSLYCHAFYRTRMLPLAGHSLSAHTPVIPLPARVIRPFSCAGAPVLRSSRWRCFLAWRVSSATRPTMPWHLGPHTTRGRVAGARALPGSAHAPSRCSRRWAGGGGLKGAGQPVAAASPCKRSCSMRQPAHCWRGCQRCWPAARRRLLG